MIGLLRQYLLCSAAMAAVSAVVLLAIPWLSRRASARSLYAALALLMIGFLVPVRPALPVSIELPRMQPRAAVQQAHQTNEAPVQPQGKPAPAPDASRLWPTLCGLWLAGIAAQLGRHLWRHQRFLRTARRWYRPADARVQAIMREEAQALHIRRAPQIMLCSAVDTPMLLGFFRPMVLLPEGGGLPDDILQLVLRHELVHLRRGDLLIKLTALLATAVHWFNPAIYVLGKALSLQCEISCDAAVVRRSDGGLRQRYGEAIIDASRGKGGCHTALSTTFDGGIKDMKQRIFSLLDMQRKRMGALMLCAVLALTLLAGAAMATGEGPAAGDVKLLHWDAVKAGVAAGDKLAVYEPGTGGSWQLSVLAANRHLDAEPAMAADTERMNTALGGEASWAPRVVYVKLPGGEWTMATTHNMPYLEGKNAENGFNGLLCVHFLRDMEEVAENDPNYGVENQEALREGWRALTGEEIDG